MTQARQYVFYGRIGICLLASGAFLLLSVFARARTEHNVFSLLFPAVALSAWIGGRLGGLVSTFVLTLGTAYYHMPPDGFGVGDSDDVVRLGTFTLSGTFVAWLSGALQESRVIMMATLRSIGDAVISTDRRGAVRLLNPAAQRLTGWSQEDAKGRPLGEVFQCVREETGAGVPVPSPERLRGVLNLPENIYLKTRSGGHVYVDDSQVRVQSDGGRIIGSIVVFRDATRRRQNEADLLESERQRLQAQRLEAIGRLAGGVAHDFNNLLTVINGNAELVLQQMDRNSPARGGLEEIRKAGEGAASLTRQLLVFSRGQPMKPGTADLNRIVANFEKMLRRLIGEDIELVTNLAGEPLWVWADISQIEQVIMNLALNARDAMPGGGRLTLATGRQARDGSEADPALAGAVEYAVLTVTDTGTGIDQQAKTHLFEPFFTTKEVGKGTGLGLSIIYGIVKSHQGWLRVSSEGGKGSVFQVWLPGTKAPAEPSAPASPEAAPRGTGTILLVEDNSEVRALMRIVLAAYGYTILEAANGVAAIQAVESYREAIDLMVSDIVMPGLDGPSLAKRLAPLQPKMKVLYVSGYADHDTAMRVLGDASAAYLQKPFRPEDLAGKVAEMIARGGMSESG